jgi:2-polyprenyl-6-methoxyphenol hydroxylase-like FAD-dependent oxidoreductase
MNHDADADVIVVGAGPTGLALASELALVGVRVRVLDRRDQESNITRAFAVHARTMELLDARRLAEQIVYRHQIRPAIQTGATAMDRLFTRDSAGA